MSDLSHDDLPQDDMLPPNVRAALAELPSTPDGWWHQADGETFEEIAAEMLGRSVDPETVIRWCTALYSAAAGEFGA